jgi:hypothetical protein
MGKHCNNSQCFFKKNYKTKFLISSKLKKKSTETILEKKHQKKGKTLCWKHYSNSQCFMMKATVLSHMI